MEFISGRYLGFRISNLGFNEFMATFYLFIILIIGFYLEGSFLGAFRLFGFVPNILISLISIFAIYDLRERPYVFAIIFGFLGDLIYGYFFGFNMLFLVFAVFVSKKITKGNAERTPLSIILILLFVIFTLHFIFQGTFYLLSGGSLTFTILKNYFIQTLLNISVGVIIFFFSDRLFGIIKTLDKNISQKIVR